MIDFFKKMQAKSKKKPNVVFIIHFSSPVAAAHLVSP